MSKTKHTPGPWKARNYKNADGDVWVDCDSWENPKTASCRGGTVATAHKGGSGQGSVTANARLIAAAPELLEFAREIKAWLVSPDLSRNVLDAYQHDAEIVIAKAERSAA